LRTMFRRGKKSSIKKKPMKLKVAKAETAMGPAEYLKKPYGRVIIPESDGTFRAEITEFPGCIAVGDTAGEALANLEDVAASWLEATLAKGQHVPEPIESVGFSGKLVLRLPKSLHRKAAFAAHRDGVSLNQFIVSCVAEQVGSRTTEGRVIQLPAAPMYGLTLTALSVQLGPWPNVMPLRIFDFAGLQEGQTASGWTRGIAGSPNVHIGGVANAGG
jgi:antitoxin HicB